MQNLRRYWWFAALQALSMVGVGIMGIALPDLYLYSLVEYLGLVFLIFGFCISLFAWLFRKKGQWLPYFIGGILELGLGLLIITYPGDSSWFFQQIIGYWALAIGLLQLIFSFTTKANRILFLINALLSGIFGTLILWANLDSEKTLTVLVGIYCVLMGVAIFYLANKMRKIGSKAGQPSKEVNAKGVIHTDDQPSAEAY